MKCVRSTEINTEVYQMGDIISFKLKTGESMEAMAVKKEENGKFKRTEFGGCASPNQPEYPQWFYRQIVKDHGNIIEEK